MDANNRGSLCMRVLVRFLWVAICCALHSAGLVLADDASELSVDQRDLAKLKGTRPDISLSVSLGHRDNIYQIGDALELKVGASEEVYLTVLNIGASGKVTVLLPNSAATGNRLPSGQTLTIPDVGAPYVIRVGEPTGFELVKVIATKRPVDLIGTTPSQPAGVFRSLDGSGQAVVRSLAQTLAQLAPDGYAVGEVVIRVVDTPPSPR